MPKRDWPLVSVLMATRDENPLYLKEAVESICRQIYTHWEFLIMDDGSVSCANYEWLLQQARTDSRIRVFRGPGVGLARALNTLIPQARGGFFARMDSDDRAYPERIMKEVEYLLRYPTTVLVGTWIRIINNDGQPIHSSCPADYFNRPWSRPAHSAWCGRMEALRSIGGYSPEFPVSQDYDCWLRLQQKGRVGVVEEILLDYRWGRISSERSVEQLQYSWIANQVHRKKIRSHPVGLSQIKTKLRRYAFWYDRKFRAQSISQQAMRHWQQDNYRLAVREFLQSLRVFPLNLKAWGCFFGVLVFHKYPSRFTQYLKLRLITSRMFYLNPKPPSLAVCLHYNGRKPAPLRMALIIPTADRSRVLARFLESAVPQKDLIAQIIIVDGGDVPVADIVEDFPQLSIYYVRASQPCLTEQKNQGLAHVAADVDLVCFFDDDIILEDGALRNMLQFWEENGEEVGGAAFNIINVEKRKTSFMKKIFLTGSEAKGRIMRSGYGAMLSPVDDSIFTDWIFGGATVWRREIFRRYRFDEWFEGYGYGEDLDFSYNVGKADKLAVIAEARVQHIKDYTESNDHVLFGKMQIVNRFYIVRKFKEFSKILFLWSSFGQMLENLYMALSRKKRIYFDRLAGNLAGLWSLVSRPSETRPWGQPGETR
ncbi:MAG TPA: glycosyltransferase [Candidatus Omnitrophota bacterium]|nr:glycosyltransferase [Candidatus Omnitrophota bacterium]